MAYEKSENIQAHTERCQFICRMDIARMHTANILKVKHHLLASYLLQQYLLITQCPSGLIESILRASLPASKSIWD